METGTCTVCGAEEIALDGDEMCADCAAGEGNPFDEMDADDDSDEAEDEM